MKKLCIFAGTTEGRELTEFLSGQEGISLTVCVATEYGESLIERSDSINILTGKQNYSQMLELFKNEGFDLVIDATHPYAYNASDNIARACSNSNTEYLRLTREKSSFDSDALYFPDIPSAVDALNQTFGNILVTTGSNDIESYKALEGFKERVYARVLPMVSSIEACLDSGLSPAHIIAMQGPFSKEMNKASLNSVSAKYMVTKESGAPGGFLKKLSAAREAHATLIVIGRPTEREGLSLSCAIDALCKRYNIDYTPTISVIGIGPGNPSLFTAKAHKAIEDAHCIIGAKRMLDSVGANQKVCFEAIDSDSIVDFISKNRHYKRFAVLMSGDTGFFSGAKKLVNKLNGFDVEVIPGISSLSYLCSRLHTSYEDIVSVSLHGRDQDIISLVNSTPRVFVLTGGKNDVRSVTQALLTADFNYLKITVGENLSYPNEKITFGSPDTIIKESFAPLSVMLIENKNADEIVTQGLPDSVFKRLDEGSTLIPMTKSEVRSLILSKLELKQTSICYDIGAGTGSCSIEMALKCKKGHVYAIEKNEAACDLIHENIKRLHTGNIEIINALAPEVFSQLPSPTHAFIGGSSGNIHNIVKALLDKRPDIRIVATAVTLETINQLTECMNDFSFSYTDVISVNISRAKKCGRVSLMAAQNPVFIFTMQNV